MKKTILFVFTVLCIFLTTIITPLYAQENEPPEINSAQLKNTTITAAMNSKIAAGKNLLYCSVFQLAWNSLIDNVVKEQILLSGDPLLAAELNKRLFKKRYLSNDAYLAMAGYKKDGIISEINKAAKKKFGKESSSLDESLLKNPNDILAYAFLYKNLKFKKEFESLDNPIYFGASGKKIPVNAFGIKIFSPGDKIHKALAKQVSILYYNNDDDFIVAIKSVSRKDEILLVKIKPGATFLETLELVKQKRSRGKSAALKEDDTLQIPKLDFKITHSYNELVGRFILNKPFVKDRYIIKYAYQRVRFRLNEKGALLKAEAFLGSGPTSAQPPRPKPKLLIFDKPFLIVMQEKGAKYPYFTLWIDNPELLIKK